MFLGVREMELKPLRFDQAIPPGVINFDSEFEQASPLVVTGTAAFHEATEEIELQGHLRMELRAACDRCLEAFPLPIESDFKLIYQPLTESAPAQEIEISAGDAEIGFYQGSGLELNEVIKEQILLALPMQLVCRKDCLGLCPYCGQNRNTTICDCKAETGDLRWAALKNL
jgi:uncharacterized protein